ncbi:VCBS repeat-containing protein, partial [bacterium]|nr:VCBS repeat-containing protein [bacterium]
MKKHLLLQITKNTFLLTALFAVLQSCESPKEVSPVYFNSITAEQSGVDFENTLTPSADLNIIEYLYFYNGAGVAIGDLNNDGLEDLFVTGNQVQDRVYENLGGLKFKDQTATADINTQNSWSNGVTLADVNNDGLLDVYVSVVGNYKTLKGHNKLFLNQGDFKFKEISNEVHIDFSGFGTQASFFDYDNDGDLDLYLLNHTVHTPRSYGKTEKRVEKDALSGDLLFENTLETGVLNFVNVTQAAGIYNSPLGYGLGLATADLNKDGFIDIYVGNDFHENDYIYLNNGDKTFREASAEVTSHSSRFTMGLDAADLNNDALIDVFTLDMMPDQATILLKSGGEDSDKVAQIKEGFGFQPQYSRNNFQLNNGEGAFQEIALLTETYATDWSWSALIEDFDNDGLSDIFISNGIYRRPNDLDY